MPSRARVTTRFNRASVTAYALHKSDEVAKTGAGSIQTRARRFAPKQSGALSRSITVTKVSGGMRTTYKIWSPLNYAAYQERGTGPIFPTKAGGVLVFKVGGKKVFARWTRGVPATHFMQRAALMVTKVDFLKP